MKTRTLVIGGITITTLVAGGWALAQTTGHRDGFGPRFMRGAGPEEMGPGMMKGMGDHGPGMMMKGMSQGSAMIRGRHGAAFAASGPETPEDRTGER
jgi:hypothetical protein